MGAVISGGRCEDRVPVGINGVLEIFEAGVEVELSAEQAWVLADSGYTVAEVGGGGGEARNVVFMGEPVTLAAEPLTIIMEGTGDVELADALAALTGDVTIGGDSLIIGVLDVGGQAVIDGSDGSIICGAVTSSGDILFGGTVLMPNLPASDPASDGQLYTTANAVIKSTGP